MKASADSEVAGAEWCLSRNREVFLNEIYSLIFLKTDCYVFVDVPLEVAGSGAGLSSSEWTGAVLPAPGEVTQATSSSSCHLVPAPRAAVAAAQKGNGGDKS